MVDEDVEYFRVVGSRPPDFREILQGGGISNTPVWRRVVGDVTLYWEDPGRFPPQGGPPAGKYSSEEDRGGHVDLSATGCGNE